jgi:hypothetical protein
VADLADRLADLAIASLRSQVEHAGPGGAAVRQLGRRAAPADYEPLRAARTAARCSRPSPTLGVPRIHFGIGTGELLTLMAEAGPTWWASTGGSRSTCRRRGSRRHRPAGQPRPGGLPRPVGRGGRGGARRAAPQRRPPRPRVQPRPRRAARDRPRRPRAGWSSWCTPRADAPPADGPIRSATTPYRRWVSWRGDGLRHARVPRGRRGLLHPHPPGSTARPPSSSPTSEALRRDRRHLPARPAHRSAGHGDRRALERANPGRFTVVLGQKHAAPVHRGRSRRAGRPRA